MKPIFDLSRITTVAMIAMIPVTLSLAACGQKGPLFMPAKLPPPVVRTAPAPASAQPNVAPETSGESADPTATTPSKTIATPTTPAPK